MSKKPSTFVHAADCLNFTELVNRACDGNAWLDGQLRKNIQFRECLLHSIALYAIIVHGQTRATHVPLIGVGRMGRRRNLTMYCTNCGAWNPDESKFCAKCGRPLEEAGQAERKGRIRSPRAMALLGLLLAIAVLCVGAYAMRDRLGRVWQSFTVQPTQVAVLPTASPTTVPAQPTATPTPMPSPSLTATEVSTPTPSPSRTPTQKPTPRPRTFALAYKECIPHGFALGSVKGQIFDKNGRVIPGAKVRITINGYEWQSAANPATANPEGWYEWTLEVGQKVQFVELIVDGKPVPFSPQGFEVEATGGCYQRVDFVEQ